ncbi:TetR/AcrR family transcriptional regulator [Oceanobacillus jeddahense]|uniref:TetR/AcrR family transcriptional regulator n=1 Tax=Oceanobacillus jeddahense TaxID=1462527 RepID=A0ABY5JWS8_9BACI|nr:TetR/AcrR family transcriptional regulator [Oceanobacillus jeddahense]UUI04843.1 TetR/AcrR family transcriptional regulator [Oceanobacillus jeddahense]
MDAAFSLFAEYGIENTSLSMISNEVGITKPSIYYHFASKEELVEQTFKSTFKGDAFENYFRMDQFNKENFGEKLYRCGLNMLPQEDKEHFTVLKVLNEFMLIAERNEKYKEEIVHIQQEFLVGFQSILKKGSELGVVLPEKIDTHAQILALVIDNISRSMMMNFQIDYQEVWKETVNSVLKEDARIN